MSGQSGKTRPASRAVTFAPKSSTANVAAAANAASSVNRWLPLPGEPRRVRRSDEQVDEQPHEGHRRGEVRRHGLAGVPEPDRLAPEPRLEPDEEHGGERRPQDRAPVAMVQRPRATAIPRIRTPMSAATVRWIHSIQTWNPASRLGRNWPSKQPGQCGHASPESVARTTTPMTTSRNVVATVAAASRWKRVTDPPGWALADSSPLGAAFRDPGLRFRHGIPSAHRVRPLALAHCASALLAAACDSRRRRRPRPRPARRRARAAPRRARRRPRPPATSRAGARRRRPSRSSRT